MCKVRRIVAIILVALMLSSCGKQIFPEPELKEPSIGNESYVPVIRGDVGTEKIDFGIVSPVTYSYFWKTMVDVKQVNVSVGDFVKEGDLLATADIKATNERIDAINRNISNLQSVNVQVNKKYEQQIQYWQYKLSGAKEINNTALIESSNLMLKELEENRYYDNLLNEHRIKALYEDIAEYNDVLANSELRATHDGYVTFRINMASESTVTKDMNVVVVSDFEDTYIKSNDKVSTRGSAYEYIYANIGGVKKNLKLSDYSDSEKIIADNRGATLCNRYVFEDGSKLPEIGKKVPIVRKNKSAIDVIVVNVDSIYDDEFGSFVYVRKNGVSEKRYIEIGIKDLNYAEVLSGLEEGEEVFYKTDASMPEMYDLYEVNSKAFLAKTEINSYKMENPDVTVTSYNGEGTISSIVPEGYEASTNDVLCVIETNKGAASLLEQSVGINDLSTNHEAACKQYNDQIKALKEEIELVQKERENSSNGEKGTTKIGNTTVSSVNVGVASNTDAKAEDSQDSTTEFENTDSNTTEKPVTEDKTSVDKKDDKNADSDEKDDAKSEAELLEERLNDPYIIEEDLCQIEIVKIDLEIENINYNYQLGEMQIAYNKSLEGNDGNGNIVFRAPAQGTVTKKYCEEGKAIQGQKKLFAFSSEGKEFLKLIVNEKTVDSFGLNQEITMKKDETIYKGKIIGINNPNESFVTTDGKEIYLTHNDAKDKCFLCVQMEDAFYANANDKFDVHCANYDIDESLCVPTRAIYSGKTKKGDEYKYVWKMVGESIVKQVVTIDIYNEEGTFILGGLKHGDVVLVEK